MANAESPPLKVDAVEQKSRLPIGSNLGPYRLVKLLGQGGMGEVYLARQTSLDRDVALKVINVQQSDSPRTLARFTREAYAAAQLVHPNIVQVYDMGDDRGYCYFSMEYVSGQTLAELVTNEQPLAPEEAASLILQAARGLAHAHAAGMVHRDVKPGNLLVDAWGVVKVADLGLVKVPDQDDLEDDDDLREIATSTALAASQDLTRFGSAVGTPYYMAPEQARNAVKVDHRADIYSLGCTFFVLLTGKKPFDGKTFEEIVKKHLSTTVIEPSRVVDRVPATLSGIVTRMMAKSPDDRYQSLNELIPELERFLGIAAHTNFVAEEGDVKTVERNAAQFIGVRQAALRGLIPWTLLAGCVIFALMFSLLNWRWASSFMALPMFSAFAYFFISGSRENSPLFAKARELVLLSGVMSWLKWLLIGLIVVGVVYLLGLYFHLLFAAILGIALAIVYHIVIDQPIIADRKKPLAETELLLRKLRLKGLSESTVQFFVAENSGRYWEEFFEHLFDYDAKRKMRDEFAKSKNARARFSFRPWRDRICDRLDSRIRQLKTAKDRTHIERIEFSGLQAEGLSEVEAREKAGRIASAMVDQAAEQKIAALEKRVAELDPSFKQHQKREQIKKLLADARSGKYRQKKTQLQQLEPSLNRYVGSYIRFLLGSLVIIGSLFWARQNGFFEVVTASSSIARDAMNQGPADQEAKAPVDVAAPVAELEKTKWVLLQEALSRPTAPLDFPILGKLLFTNFNALIAGSILVASSMISGWKMTLFAIPAAAIAIVGPHLFGFDLETIPAIHSLSALIAGGVFVLGIVFGRAED